jgi:ribosome maturation factor RimP
LVAQRGFELVQLSCYRAGRSLGVRILADRPEGGITIEECAQLNRQISMTLDEKELIQERYVLEVSSPGLDRPLRTKKDFSRCLNKKVQIFLREPVFEKLQFQGTITNVTDESVKIETAQGAVDIPLAAITKATQAIE